MTTNGNGNGNIDDFINESLNAVRLNPVTHAEYRIQFEDVYQTPLAKRLVELRKAVGLDQAEFSKKLDISLRTISRLENGKTELSESHRQKYLEMFAKHPDGKNILYYADDQLSQAFCEYNSFQLEHKTVWMRRYWDKITDYFDDFNAQAKQALEANLNFVITQSVGSKNMAASPTFSDSLISLRTTVGWGFGVFELKASVESQINQVIKVPYARMRIIRGLGYQIGTSKEMSFDYEVYTSGSLGKASDYLNKFPYKFVTDNSIESPFLFLAKGNDWSDVITFKKEYGFLGRMLQKLIYPLRKILGVALEGEKLNFGFHGMTTAGFKVITAKDRELTVMFHYDSYEVDGKKYSKGAFEKLIFDDLEKIVPIIREFVIEHEVAGRDDKAAKTIRSRSMRATPTEIVARRNGVNFAKEGWKRG